MTQLTGDLQWLMRHKGRMRQRDGAIIDPVVDALNGIQWFFQFRKYHPGPYKWLAIGEQSPISISIGTITPTPINTWVYGGSGLVLPFTGLWWTRMFGQKTSSAVATHYVGISLDQATPYAQGTFNVSATDASTYTVEFPGAVDFPAGHALYSASQCTVLGPVLNSSFIQAKPRAIQL